MIIREEQPGDETRIAELIEAAFRSARHSDGNEARIVEGLRTAGALAISLVAERDGGLAGHIAFSPVRIDGAAGGWYGLGPVSVLPAKQRGGIGSALVRSGLARLGALGAEGCVLLGDPGYYTRFGFRRMANLVLSGVPAEYFLALPLNGTVTGGEVSYHRAFYPD